MRKMNLKLMLVLILLVLSLSFFAACSKKEVKKKKGDTTTTTQKEKMILPLRGTEVDSIPQRPVIVVKIGNNPEARPQTGLNDADIVFEEVVEGGITRYVGVFQSKAQDLIGPVRSVRGMDPNIAKLFGGIFAYSGGTQKNESAIQSTTGIKALNETSAKDAMIRTKDRYAPNNLYIDSKKMWALADENKAPDQLFQYSKTALETGAPVKNFTIPFTSGFQATFTSSSGGFLKSSPSGPVLDNNKVQVSPANVLVMAISYPNYSEGIVIGSGKLWVFSNGKYVEGTWSRVSADEKLKLIDSTGNEIKLSPGQTFIELMPNSLTPQIA